MGKWAGIRGAAAIAVVGGIVTLLVSALLGLVLLLSPPRYVGPFPPAMVKAGGIILALAFFCFAIWVISSGIGVFRRRDWARLSMIILGGLLAFFGGTGGLAMLLTPFPETPGVNRELGDAVRKGIITAYALIAVTGTWYVALFSRKGAAEYFRAKPPEPARPLSITVIGVLFLAHAMLSAFAAVVQAPAFLLGEMHSAWVAPAVYTAQTAVLIYLGAGLLQLDNKARIGSIAFLCLAGANGLLLFLGSGAPARIGELQDGLDRMLRLSLSVTVSLWVPLVIGALATFVPMWFLLRRASAFQHRSQAGPNASAIAGLE